MTGRRMRCCVAAILFIALGGLHPVIVLAATLETEIKATFLYKFAAFVEWPDQVLGPPAARFTICVAGTDPFQGALAEAIAGETVMGHLTALHHLVRATPNAGCEIMFIDSSPGQSVGAALAAVRGATVLTVTDQENGPHGIINFVLRDDHVRFEIDRAAAAQNHLAISSKLLNVAVPDGPAE
ncbi:MAG: YfiR family protein [Stellaceae bacterium]